MIEETTCTTCEKVIHMCACSYWEERLTRHQAKTQEQCIIDGDCYQVMPEKPGLSIWSRGFGGQEFTIKRDDLDEPIKTRNLWYNGKIPPFFREQMPDNAKFVRGD